MNLGPPSLLVSFASLTVACGGLSTGEPILAGDAGSDVVGADAGKEAASPGSDSGMPHPDAADDAGVCTEAERAAVWANMLMQPIHPRESAALLDLRGTFPSLAKAESILCVGDDLGDLLEDGTRVEAWGQSHEVELNYDPATGAGISLTLGVGYVGACDCTSDPKGPEPGNRYRVVLGQEFQKNGAPFEIDWNDPKLVSLMEIYNAQMYTFGGPGIYSGYDSGDCSSQDACLVVGPDAAPEHGGVCMFGVQPIVTTWETSCPNVLQPGVSTIDAVVLRP
jgi:hypothetical protein